MQIRMEAHARRKRRELRSLAWMTVYLDRQKTLPPLERWIDPPKPLTKEQLAAKRAGHERLVAEFEKARERKHGVQSG